MTKLSTALSNSFSGLSLASRMIQTISNNVSNATTDGYAAREVIPTARNVNGIGMGVSVGEISRDVDPVLVAERRVADGQYEFLKSKSDFYLDVENAIGLPNVEGSLANRFANLNAKLIEASARPESDIQLNQVLTAAQAVTKKLNDVSDYVQSTRMRADQEIEKQVNLVNDTLRQISELNVPGRANSGNMEVSLNKLDQRGLLIDKLSKVIPVKEVQRDNGSVMLFTSGGAILLDGRPAELDFSSVGVITAPMAIGGALSGLTINGQPIDTTLENNKISGGRLAALFDIRDSLAPQMQGGIDSIARDLIERFADSTVDPTLNPGDAGLFTDGGAAFDATNEVGISARISLNSAADPSNSGAIWRLRDGLNAVAIGPLGNSDIINNMSSALKSARLPASGGFGQATSSIDFASQFTVSLASTQSNIERETIFVKSSLDTLTSAELERGVDTDLEMRRLLQVEKAYAANAQIISTIDELLDELLRIS